MYGFFLTILVLDGIFLSVVILLQAGKGGGLAAMGGGGGTMTEGVLGGRQATSFLTRATWVSGAAFMVLALILAILSSRADRPGSILEGEFQSAPAVPAPVLPGTQPLPGGAGGAVPPSDGVESPGEG
jgi:preprotein translocase subunit SecG